MFEKGSKGYVLGYDLGDQVSQISFMALDGKQPETLSVQAGVEAYNIPMLLSKRRGVNQWFFGKDAQKRIEKEGDIPVSGLLQAVRSENTVNVDGTEYDPVALLTLFIKRSLSLLSMELSLKNVRGVMFTTGQMDEQMVAVLEQVTGALGLETEHVFFQSHEESMYFYMLTQQEKLRQDNVIAFDYNFGNLSVYDMHVNHNTKPKVITIAHKNFDSLEVHDSLPEDPEEKKKFFEILDADFLDLAKENMKDTHYSSVYLLGDGFKDNWTYQSRKFLCTGRHVFQGNNLFSKGASIAAGERIKPTEAFEQYFLLGDHKLKSNIGILLRKQGVDTYFALLDAGGNWYEAEASVEVILESGREITLQKVALENGKQQQLVMSLEGLPERKERQTRLQISVHMMSVSQMRVTVTDLGFGEIVPATSMNWTETFDI